MTYTHTRANLTLKIASRPDGSIRIILDTFDSTFNIPLNLVESKSLREELTRPHWYGAKFVRVVPRTSPEFVMVREDDGSWLDEYGDTITDDLINRLAETAEVQVIS